MKKQEVRVTFQPSGRSVYVLPGTVLLEAAGRAGITLKTPCGGAGTCGKCRVRVTSGTDNIETDPAHERDGAVPSGQVLACGTFVNGEVVVDVPNESMFETTQQILTQDTGEIAKLHPMVTKQDFELPAPTAEDPSSDLERLRRQLGRVTVPHRLLRRLPAFLRANDWRGKAVLAGSRVIGLEHESSPDSLYGAAFDLGTTTVVGTLFDLASGRECALASMINPQVAFGDDVISRINRIRENPGSLLELQQSITEGINKILDTLASQAGVSHELIYEIVIAGNSTMQQIFCGLDPSALGEMPFVQVFEDAQQISAARLGIRANEGAEVFVFPQIGSFVGGDTVAGLVASRLDRFDDPALFVDIGTNGEIVLAHNGELLATSTAAGPAFEGARITQGMRAATGAIEKVLINHDVTINVIGNTQPSGICGTALIDTVAGLLRAGIIDETGRILADDELPDDIPQTLRARLITDNDDTRFLLAAAAESASGEAIYLWQRDVRELQLATGAIRAGINILLQQANIEANQLGAVLLAGAFGNFIRRSNARRIGLLPAISRDRIRFIGNAASMGAKLALLSREETHYAAALKDACRHVDLSLDPGFQMEFGMAMIFPGNDVDDNTPESD